MEKQQRDNNSKRKLQRLLFRYTRLFVIVLAGVTTGTAIFYFIFPLLTPKEIHIPMPGGKGHKIVLHRPSAPSEKVMLVMGVDSNLDPNDPGNFNGTRSDTMLLVRVSPDKKTVSMISIPRDSKIYYGNGGGIGKINAAYAFGGADLAVKTVEKAFGIPIDNYIVVNTQGIREVVDSIDGVEVYVDKPLKYRDRTAKLDINLDVGKHVLNGQQAEGFVRFRHDAMGDIGRVRRQQQFIKAVARRFKDPWVWTKIPRFIEVGSKYIQTDLSGDELVKLVWFAKDVDDRNIRSSTLPGYPVMETEISYWIISPKPAKIVLDRLILDNPFSEEKQNMKSAMKVGIFYSEGVEENLPNIVQSIEDKGFEVVCKTKKGNQRTTIVEHSARVTDDRTNLLRSSDSRFENARLIFAPVGTTFEVIACSMQEDYTLIIGQDN